MQQGGRLTRLAYANCAKYDIDRDDVCYCCMPLFHGNALMALWAPALSQGATVCLVRKFTASGFMPDVRFYGATYFTYVGKALGGYLMATPELPDDIENTLTHGFGTEASPGGDKAEFIRRFGAQLFEGYGSSEGAGSVVLDPNQPAGALGRPASENIVIVDPDTREERPPRAILDEHGHVLNPPDESIGEMVDKAGSKKFEGYYKNEDAIAEKIRHGWYWTGDLATSTRPASSTSRDARATGSGSTVRTPRPDDRAHPASAPQGDRHGCLRGAGSAFG